MVVVVGSYGLGAAEEVVMMVGGCSFKDTDLGLRLIYDMPHSSRVTAH